MRGRNKRMNENKNKIFHSFSEVASYLGFDSTDKKKKVKEEQIIRFKKYHLCPACHRPMTYCGGNIMVCQTESCKGIAHKSIDPETGKERTWYSACYHVLDTKGEQIAERLFSE